MKKQEAIAPQVVGDIQPSLEIQPGEAQVNMYIPGQAAPLIVSGNAETIRDLYESGRRDKVRPVIAKTAVQAPVTVPKTEQLQTLPLYGRGASRASLKAVLFDIRFGGGVYKQLIEKRRQERVLAMQMELGIISTVHCRLHEKLASKA